MYIGIFTPQNSSESVASVLAAEGLSEEFRCFPYDGLDDLCRQYTNFSHEMSGILFTGGFTMFYFQRMFPSCTLPISCIEHAAELCYIHLIKLLDEEPELSLNEIYCDFIAVDKQYDMISEIISPERIPQTTKLNVFYPDIFDRLCTEIEELYKAGRIKMALITLSTLYDKLQARHIPCRLVGIRRQDIASSLHHIKAAVAAQGETKSFTAVIDCTYNNNIAEDFSEIEYSEATMMKVIVDYKKESKGHIRLDVLKASGIIELYCEYMAIEGSVYEEYAHLAAHIRDNYRGDFAMGIGTGANTALARKNSFTALDFSRNYGDRYTFTVENTTVTGPVGETGCMAFDTSILEKADEMSKKLNISRMNYTRAMYLFQSAALPGQGNGCVTSDMLSAYLNITVRSANRIISALLENDIIKEVPAPQNEETKKGRPTKHYALLNLLDFFG